jgi:hypothetical protein
MPWTAGPKTQWLEDLHKVLAAERIDPMSDNNDRSDWRESGERDNPEPMNPDLELMGFSFDPVKKCLVWNESISYDPTDPWCVAIDEKIRKDDRAFLTGCGINAEDL